MKTPEMIERSVSSRDVIEMISISEQISCVRITTTTTITQKNNNNQKISKERLGPECTVIEGFAETTAIKNWTGNSKAPLKGQIFLSAPGFAENFRLWGMPGRCKNDKDWDNKYWETSASKTPYTAILANPNVVDLVLEFNGFDNGLAKLDGSLVPAPIFFDYIAAGMHNNDFDLEKVADILSTRKDIAFFINDGVDKLIDARQLEEKHLKKIIQSVPYYNNEEGDREFVQFIWRPSDEDFANLQKAINPPESKESKGIKGRKGRSYEIFNYIYEQNVLGLNEARIPKVSDKPTPVKSKYR